ncbi:deoxyribonuclease IV [Candidatus Phytoplasma meliae]|uniref:Probable endonuclease 4 n=1 Tax=Candidatus Phytoplasma meliae TaxID=1848402 RepID=A0ABS5CZ45_9MOLU|nr:deoxyribonuclease IV [Candidatus Phytoplasma meliae]MBP5836147.1 deoxyribonuclease IV [Candidatus Phytoplasma meliae]MBP5836250.1 deoxyribonuclease IV [Candidatus Phytoplasma meliae]
MLILGSHVPMKKPDNYLGAIKHTSSYQANTFMVYSGAPQNTIRTSISQLQIPQALQLASQNNLTTNYFVGHAPYIVNLANPCEHKRIFAINFLVEELVRFDAMKINQMVLHPGNALKQSVSQAIALIAQGLDVILAKTKHLKIKIALETMAGKGTEVGKTLEELRQIRHLVNYKQRVSFCLDTCHLFDAGYDLKNNLTLFLQDLDLLLGINHISVIHLNDSKNICASRKDRHENIGFGEIGFDALMRFAKHSFFEQIPKILETPYINGKAPYQKEIQMIRNKKFNPELKKAFFP